MTDNYKILLLKIDEFIKKYYTNKILRGFIISITIISFIFLLISILEYYNYFNTYTKTIVFYTFIVLSLIVLFDLTILPFLKFFRIGKIISYQRASTIITQHFFEIKDRLLNILELANENSSNALVFASIDQKIHQIKLFNFKEVIDFKENIKYLKYIVFPFLIFLYLLIFRPTILLDGTNRFINYSTHFSPEAPFQFNLLTDSLNIRKGTDLTLELEISGKYVPSEIYINYANSSFLMKSDDKNKQIFTYDLKNINNQIEFNFEADNLKSDNFIINVLSPPIILDFVLTTFPPAYTNEISKIYENVGDITITKGTILKWNFNIQNIDSLYILISDSLKSHAVSDNSKFLLNKQILQSCAYKIIATNQFFSNEEIMNFNLTVIPDLYPDITVDNAQDSSQLTLYYYRGLINDDYGFTNLTFNYAFIDDNNDEISDYESVVIDIAYNQTIQEFYYFVDFNDLKLTDENIKYYFEIFDNDKISGSKSTKTRTFQYNFVSYEDVTDKADSLNQNISDNFSKASSLLNELQSDINEFKKKSVNEELSEWEQQNFMEQILNKQQNLEQLLQEMKQDNEEKNNNLNTFTEEQQELLEKQKLLEELMNELMTDEIKELLKQIEELKEKMDQSLLKELAEKLEQNYKELDNNLDRNLELMKQLQVEEKVNTAIEQLEKLSEEMEQLSEETKDNENSLEELTEENLEKSEEFKKIMEEYKEAQDLNEQLENPQNLENFETEESEINQEMSESQQSLQESNRRKSSKSQQSASEKMQKMSEQMSQMMMENEMESSAENIEDMEQLLTNLINFSFAQEDLISSTKSSFVNDPSFNDIILAQNNLTSDFQIINDSLDALAKRVPQIGTPVNTALNDINENLALISENLQTKKSTTAAIKQQLVMTYTNDLALLFEEVLDQMQQQMSQMQGSGTPQEQKGQGMPSMADMKGSQQSLQKQLEQMLQQMKENGGSMGEGQLNQQLAKMLAEQEMFEKMLQDLMNGSTINPDNMKILNEINKASDEIKEDIINNNITPQTLLRQQEILTRLLEAEKSENERELEEKREAKEAL
jgi:hypothetical protein